jgi:hypothetical protein
MCMCIYIYIYIERERERTGTCIKLRWKSWLANEEILVFGWQKTLYAACKFCQRYSRTGSGIHSWPLQIEKNKRKSLITCFLCLNDNHHLDDSIPPKDLIHSRGSIAMAKPHGFGPMCVHDHDHSSSVN